MQQKNNREDGDEKTHTQAVGASLWVVLEVKQKRDIQMLICIHTNTHGHTDLQESEGAGSIWTQLPVQRAVDYLPAPWKGFGQELPQHQVTTPSLPWTGGSWQKCHAGKAHVGASNSKELKISWPVKNVAETPNWCMGCNYFLSPRKKNHLFYGKSKRKWEWKSLQGSLEVRHPKGRSPGEAEEVKTRMGEICKTN